MASELPTLDVAAFRRDAHAIVDWMADYLAGVGELRVQPDAPPGAVRAQIPGAPPEHGEPFARIREDFERIVMPGMVHWGHPGFFGYFPANTSPPSILAEMLTATIGAQCMSWNTSPAATELEQAMMEWLRGMIGLPDLFTGVIQDTASTATLVAWITARDRAGVPVERQAGYTTAEANSSVPKGARLAGFAPERIRLVATDGSGAMRADALGAAMAADRAAGLVPSCVVATVGTTGTTAIDPVPAIAAHCRAHGAWLHVDAAWAGSAAIVPELRWILEGAEAADSLVFNPHKWLLVNFDCSAYFVRDPAALRRSFGASLEILKGAHDDRVVNYRDWGIQLGRRFRALKLWFVIRSYGVEGLRALVREHVRLGQLFAGWVENHPGLELLAPAPLGLVVFRHRGTPGERADAASARLLAALNATGRVLLTHTTVGGRYALRLALGHLTTREADVRAVWELLAAGAAPLR